MRAAVETVKLTYFSSKRRLQHGFHCMAGLLAAFFGKLIKFKKSTRETTVALIHPFKFLSASDTTDFSMQIRIFR